MAVLALVFSFNSVGAWAGDSLGSSDAQVEEAKTIDAENQNIHGTLQLGLGASGTYDASGTNTVGTFAEFYARYFQAGHRSDYNRGYVPFITLTEGEIHYNVIGKSTEGVATGVRGAATLIFGAHNLLPG